MLTARYSGPILVFVHPGAMLSVPETRRWKLEKSTPTASFENVEVAIGWIEKKIEQGDTFTQILIAGINPAYLKNIVEQAFPDIPTEIVFVDFVPDHRGPNVDDRNGPKEARFRSEE